jgi:ABC-type dipeptide/oligopeptide/nickel transport system ATPase component
MSGILEKIIYDFEQKTIESRGIVKINYIIEFIRALQKNEYDAHVCIMGQNGNGKSYMMLTLLKLLDANAIKNNQIVYSYDKTSRLISLLKDSKEKAIGIDEGKKFFHYKQSMNTEQIVLQNMIEYARENKNAFVVCTNDIRRLNNNYRNAKVQILVWLLDRYDEKEKLTKSYGLVFIGNPALEEEDKFQMNFFSGLYSFENIRIVAESLPTFYGYIFLEDVANLVSSEEISIYREQKSKGVQDIAKDYLKKLAKKEDEEVAPKESLKLNKSFIMQFLKK